MPHPFLGRFKGQSRAILASRDMPQGQAPGQASETDELAEVDDFGMIK